MLRQDRDICEDEIGMRQCPRKENKVLAKEVRGYIKAKSVGGGIGLLEALLEKCRKIGA